jgi:hypothetical protein
MKCAAMFVVALLSLATESFGVLRPRFPVKAMPPFTGGTGFVGDDILRNSAKEAFSRAPK